MARIRQNELVAMAMPPGPAWLKAVGDIWEAGAAVLPLDHRLTAGETERLLERAGADAVLDGETLARRPSGRGVEPGVALVMATSGTTGPPRLAELTRGAIQAAVTASARRLAAGPGDGWLCCLPLAHMGGMLVLARALLLGVEVAVHPRFDPTLFEQARDPRFTSLVPTMLLRLLDAGAGLARFRAILVGGAPVPDPVASRAAAAGAAVVRTYGLTESCGGVVYDGLPLDGVEIRTGDGGEVQLRGATIFRGYRSDPEGTTARFTDDGWLRTGDAGEVVNGRLVVRGRMDEAIVSGGDKVWPAEVEAVLVEDASVAQAMVGGAPDPEWGERVVAYVVPADPSRPPTLERLRDAVTARLARYKAPRELVLVDVLPATRSGKPVRPARSSTADTSPEP